MQYINILDAKFRKIAIIDNFISLMWCKRYNSVGALDLEVEASAENLKLLTIGRYISRDDDDAIYRIQAVEYNDREDKVNTLIVGGVDLQAILKQRICRTQFAQTDMKVEDYIYKLVDENFIHASEGERNIKGFTLGDKKGFNDVLTAVQTSIGMNIGDEIESLCQAYNYGYKITKIGDTFKFELYKGRELNVEFSYGFDNLISSKYSQNAEDTKNSCLVKGTSELNEYYESVGTATGLERYEAYVESGKEFVKTDNYSEEDFLNALREYGAREIALMQNNKDFESEVSDDVFFYKIDYNLGDVVKVKNEVTTARCRITEIIETWDENGYTIEPIFEIVEIIEKESGLLLTERKETMTTENNEFIKLEQSEE